MFEEMNNFFDARESGAEVTVPIADGTFTTDDSVNTDVVSDEERRELEFEKRVSECGINISELRGILRCKSNALIQSGAGSGKTTALIIKLIHDMYMGYCHKAVGIPSVDGVKTVYVSSNILVTTFLKSGATDLKNTFTKWIERLGIRGIDTSKVSFRTLHSEVLNALEGMGVTVNIEENGKSCVKKAMKSFGIRSERARMGYTSGRSEASDDEVRDVESILAYVRNRLDDKKYDHKLMEDYSLNSGIVDGLLKLTKTERSLNNKLDYDDLQELILDGLKRNPAVVKYVGERYDYIYCDEFQDTSQLQYAILQYYFNSAKRVICIGDDDQCIYGWRGSDVDIITTYFREDYKPEFFQLTTNYRCRSNILNCVVSSISQNKNRTPKPLHSSMEGGTVEVYKNYPVTDLIKRMRADMYEGKRVGVLSRTNNDLLIPALILEIGGGVDFSVSKKVGVRRRLPQQVFGLLDLIGKRYADSFVGYFNMALSYYSRNEAVLLSEMLRTDTTLSIFTMSEDDLEYSVRNLWVSLIKPMREVREKDGDLACYDFLLCMLRNSYAFSGTSAYCQKARAFVDFTRELVKSELCRDMTVFELSNLFNSVLPAHIEARATNTNARVTLTTVHEAKGKEWDSVYIWNDTDGTFPDVVGDRGLTEDEMEEERRVHYIAWTRAKQKLTVYTRSGAESPFLDECVLSGDGVQVFDYADRDYTVGEKLVLGGNR